jgi:hypothetical protein
MRRKVLSPTGAGRELHEPVVKPQDSQRFAGSRADSRRFDLFATAAILGSSVAHGYQGVKNRGEIVSFVQQALGIAAAPGSEMADLC